MGPAVATRRFFTTLNRVKTALNEETAEDAASAGGEERD